MPFSRRYAYDADAMLFTLHATFFFYAMRYTPLLRPMLPLGV